MTIRPIPECLLRKTIAPAPAPPSSNFAGVAVMTVRDRARMQGDDQPWIDHWPTWDEPLSKVVAGVDIAAARERLARNSDIVIIGPAMTPEEING
jgi:hypothetical protein